VEELWVPPFDLEGAGLWGGGRRLLKGACEFPHDEVLAGELEWEGMWVGDAMSARGKHLFYSYLAPTLSFHSRTLLSCLVSFVLFHSSRTAARYNCNASFIIVTRGKIGVINRNCVHQVDKRNVTGLFSRSSTRYKFLYQFEGDPVEDR
jgi:hypothetical protein